MELLRVDFKFVKISLPVKTRKYIVQTFLNLCMHLSPQNIYKLGHTKTFKLFLRLNLPAILPVFACRVSWILLHVATLNIKCSNVMLKCNDAVAKTIQKQ